MIHNNKKHAIVFISPRPYWDGMKNNLLGTEMKGIRYYQDAHYSLSDLAKALGELEKRTWSTPTPAFVRSNFGLYGPGTIIAIMFGSVCIGAVYFVGPSIFERRIHIWSLFVDPRYRRMGLATRLLKVVAKATHGLIDSISYQTRLVSGTLLLYLQMGSNILVNCHTDDTNGDWTNPKIVLDILPSKRWRTVPRKSDLTFVKHTERFGIDSPFWKQLNTDSSLQRKYEIIGYSMENSKSNVYLRSL